MCGQTICKQNDCHQCGGIKKQINATKQNINITVTVHVLIMVHLGTGGGGLLTLASTVLRALKKELNISGNMAASTERSFINIAVIRLRQLFP